MFDESIKLLEMPELESISLCVYVEHDELFALGQKINAKYEEAYMNGYNWDAIIRAYVHHVDPKLMSEVGSDPEAGMYSAYMSYSPENLNKMKQFEQYVRDLLASEESVFKFIEEHFDEIEWD